MYFNLNTQGRVELKLENLVFGACITKFDNFLHNSIHNYEYLK